jgi:hypothetical protein
MELGSRREQYCVEGFQSQTERRRVRPFSQPLSSSKQARNKLFCVPWMWAEFQTRNGYYSSVSERPFGADGDGIRTPLSFRSWNRPKRPESKYPASGGGGGGGGGARNVHIVCRLIWKLRAFAPETVCRSCSWTSVTRLDAVARAAPTRFRSVDVWRRHASVRESESPSGRRACDMCRRLRASCYQLEYTIHCWIWKPIDALRFRRGKYEVWRTANDWQRRSFPVITTVCLFLRLASRLSWLGVMTAGWNFCIFSFRWGLNYLCTEAHWLTFNLRVFASPAIPKSTTKLFVARRDLHRFGSSSGKHKQSPSVIKNELLHTRHKTTP